MEPLKLHGKDYHPRKRTYPNGRKALLLVNLESDEPDYFCASVNLPDVPLASNQTLLKGWSENEGIPAALYEAGVCRDTGERIPTGFCQAEVATIDWSTIPTYSG